MEILAFADFPEFLNGFLTTGKKAKVEVLAGIISGLRSRKLSTQPR